MADVIDYPYEKMAAFKDACIKIALVLEQNKDEIAKMAAGFHGGDFLGKPGEALASALAQQLNRSVDSLAQEYRAMAADIDKDAQDQLQADQRGHFA